VGDSARLDHSPVVDRRRRNLETEVVS
jgi:hypothetical protein